MKEALLQFFQEYPHLAPVISLFIGTLLTVIGVVPTFFITAANILAFGFWEGVVIAFAAEAIGSVIGFYLYRKGFKKNVGASLAKYPSINTLLQSDGLKAFWLIFILRLIPFTPSGLVTFAAAIGRVSTLVFAVSSSLGKLIILLAEGYAFYKAVEIGWQGQVAVTLIAVLFLAFFIRKLIRQSAQKP